jgi:hypothetical protein
VLGNSGKPATLETSSLTKFLRYVFRGKAFAIFRNLEPVKPWSRGHAIFRNLGPVKPRGREHAIFGNLESAKPWSREHAKVWNLEPAKSRTSGDGKFGNLSEVWFGSRERGNSRTSEKQSFLLLSSLFCQPYTFLFFSSILPICCSHL